MEVTGLGMVGVRGGDYGLGRVVVRGGDYGLGRVVVMKRYDLTYRSLFQ